jgi:hypothetical protein
MSISPITHNQFIKIVKAFAYIVASYILAAIPVFLTKNNLWLSSMVPINLLLVTFKQLVTQDETQAVQQLDPAEQQVMSGVEQLANQGITDLNGKPVTDPNAAR